MAVAPYPVSVVPQGLAMYQTAPVPLAAVIRGHPIQGA